MIISGFSFVRNGVKLYYPVVEMIKSILPLVDEFIIAVGQGDRDDTTRKDIESIGNSKIKIIDTQWEEKYYRKGIINAIQTDLAKEKCRGDWLFYLQADEVVHEKYLPVIKNRCEQLLDHQEVEGLLFRYKHFWGDYWHYHQGHGWYPYEIRIIRNDPDIHSWQSAQSFRRFSYYQQPRQEKGHCKLKVAKVDAEIFHYGWVRPPGYMQNKRKALDSVHWGKKKAEQYYKQTPVVFDYGPLDRLAVFQDSHPEVMNKRIERFNWKEQLQYSGKSNPHRELHKHEKFKYRFLSFIERNFFNNRKIGEFKNYILIKNV
jgi:hypothetical protein